MHNSGRMGENWKKCTIEWSEVSSRLIYVIMKIGESKYIIVGVYGQGPERKKEECESFWYDLGELVGSFKSDEIACVLWDPNARVEDNKVQGVIGDYGVPGMNESGDWMDDWCMQYEMTVCNPLFKKRDGQKSTISGREKLEVK